MRECKEMCLRSDRISFGFGGKIYQSGIKYCATCNMFMKTDEYRCLCCKSNLRCKSHTKKWKNLHRQRGLAI